MKRAGRPRAASCEMIEEAASQLFLEQGYAATSISDITARAGIGRATFFNYFGSKSDLLWSTFDAIFASLPERLVAASGAGTTAGETARAALATLAAALPPENIALAYGNAGPMGLRDELRLAAAQRIGVIGAALAEFAEARGLDPVRAEVGGVAYAGALIAAVKAWSRAPAGARNLPEILAEALRPVVGALDSEDR